MQTTLKTRVYPAWAMKKEALEMKRINKQIYHNMREDKSLIKLSREHWNDLSGADRDNLCENYAVIVDEGVGYTVHNYTIQSNVLDMPIDNIALFADDGNLCFGYRKEGNRIVIYTD